MAGNVWPYAMESYLNFNRHKLKLNPLSYLGSSLHQHLYLQVVYMCLSGDGSCFYINSSLETTTELTGSDCDPLYKTVTDGKFLYTACRDSAIRKYLLSQAGL